MQKKNVKNVLAAALMSTVLFFTPSLVLSADVGNIDGLWAVPAAGAYFGMIRENQGLVLITALDGSDMTWDAFYGPISGNSADIQLLLSSKLTEVAGNITFTSPDSGVMVITNCQPPEACTLPCNMEIPFIKLF